MYDLRRRMTPPTSPKLTIIMAHVDGSGTAVVTGS